MRMIRWSNLIEIFDVPVLAVIAGAPPKQDWLYGHPFSYSGSRDTFSKRVAVKRPPRPNLNSVSAAFPHTGCTVASQACLPMPFRRFPEAIRSQ